MSRHTKERRTAKGPNQLGPEPIPGDAMEQADLGILEPIEFGPDDLTSHAAGPDSAETATPIPPPLINPKLKTFLVHGFGCPRHTIEAETREAAAMRYFEAYNLNPARPISGLNITEIEG